MTFRRPNLNDRQWPISIESSDKCFRLIYCVCDQANIRKFHWHCVLRQNPATFYTKPFRMCHHLFVYLIFVSQLSRSKPNTALNLHNTQLSSVNYWKLEPRIDLILDWRNARQPTKLLAIKQMLIQSNNGSRIIQKISLVWWQCR